MTPDPKKLSTADLIRYIVRDKVLPGIPVHISGMINELNRRVPVPQEAPEGAPDEGSTIDGREKLLYEMWDALNRLVAVIEPNDKARHTWAYEHAQAVLSESAEWARDEEHVFGEIWQERRKQRRLRVPK